MAKQNEHGKLIAAAAKAALAPLGCKRKGQSRVWISDQGFYAIGIEFQPSGWSKGSYLNVGACWLWRAQDHWTFDAGYRKGDFIPFESAEQFTPLIAMLAERAAQEVLILRERFKLIADTAKYLCTWTKYDGWWIYHAAIAAGLAGDVATAESLFRRFNNWANSAYGGKRDSDGPELMALVHDTTQYRARIRAIIDESRSLHRLPPDPDCFQGEFGSPLRI
jgi:hypothetical protein